MNEILSSQTFLLTLTLAVYLGSMWLYKKVRFALLHPLIVSMGVLILFLKLSGIPYDLFMKQIQIIDFMLGLSVVALGYLLHEQISQIKGNVIAIVTAIVTGSAVGILSVALIARAMGAEQAVIASLEPKSVTTAIALNVSAQSGGIPALTAVVVILVGIFGGVLLDAFDVHKVHRQLLRAFADERFDLDGLVIEVFLRKGVHVVARLGIEQVVEDHRVVHAAPDRDAQPAQHHQVEFDVLADFRDLLVGKDRTQCRDHTVRVLPVARDIPCLVRFDRDRNSD